MSRPFEKISKLRSQLPAEIYYGLLHCAAVTGRMPVLDPVTLKQTGESDDLDGIDQRIKITQYLLDKVMPAVKAIDEADTTTIVAEKMAKIMASGSDPRKLPAADLLAMIEAAPHGGDAA